MNITHVHTPTRVKSKFASWLPLLMALKTKSRILAARALVFLFSKKTSFIWCGCFGDGIVRKETYRFPTKNTADTSSFLLKDMCKFQVHKSGNSSIRMSDITLKIPVAKI